MKFKCLLLAMMSSMLWWQAPAFADDAADLAAAKKAMENYFAITRKAKGITDVAPLLTKRNQENVKTNPVPKEFEEMAMTMVRSSVPSTYKIDSEKAEKDKVTFTLSAGATQFPKDGPMEMPKDVVAHGEFIVVREDGEWKVDKDYWTAASSDGTFKMTFGTNPDKKKERQPADNKSSE
jgi:hypothetical protein